MRNKRIGVIKQVSTGDFGKVWRFLNNFCDDNNRLPRTSELKERFPDFDEDFMFRVVQEFQVGRRFV